MNGFISTSLTALWLGTSTAIAGTCGLVPDDCDGDGYLDAVDRCPFTADADNSQTLLTYVDSTERLPTGAACTDPSAMVDATASLGHGVELGSGATVMEYAMVGDFALLGGNDEPAVVGRRAALVDAPSAEQGIVFRSGSIGARTTLGTDPSEPYSSREGGVVTGLDLTASRSATIGFGAQLGDRVVLGYGSVVGPSAILGNNVTLGALTEVGFGAILGDNVVLARSASVGAGSQLGDGVIIGPEVRIGGGTLIEGTEDGGPPVRLRKRAVVGTCATIEAGATVGREADIADHAVVGSGTSLAAHSAVGQGGTACSGSGTRNGAICRDDGRYQRGEQVGGDPENTTCPDIVAPTPDADLSIDPFILTARTPAGFGVPVSLTVRNTGADPSRACFLELAWSTDSTWTEAACSVSFDALDGGAVRTLGTECAAPAVPGPYRLIARIDATERTAETDESNNDTVSGVVTVQVIESACGADAGSSHFDTPSAALCAHGDASVVTGSGPYSWTCTDGDVVASCTADRSCADADSSWTVSGSECDASLARADHGTSSGVADVGLPTTGSRSYTCDQGSWLPDGPGTCVTAVDAVCGAADGANSRVTPSTDLCASGTPTAVTGSGPYAWTCQGSDGGVDDACSSDRSCDTTNPNWTVGGSSCGGNLMAADSGQSRVVSDSGLPTTGSRTYTCSQGSWSGDGTGSCVTAVYGACGAADGTSIASTPTTGLCADGTASSVSGSGPYTWTCAGSDGGTTASCSANRSCVTDGQSWSVGGSSCSATTSGVAHGGSTTASDGGLPTTGSRTYACSQGTWSGSGTGSCVTAVYGSCGSANGGNTTGTPTSGLCSSGSATSVSGSGPYSWSCQGSNGGSTASCSSNRSCVTAGQSWSVSGSSCSGSVSAINHGGTRTASDGGLPTTGSRNYVCSQGSWSGSGTGSCVTAVYGSCGSANGGSYTSAPTSSLCSSGSATSVSGSGPYSWSCVGSNGGSTASCSANRSCTNANQSWSVSGSSCSGSVSAINHGGTRTASDGGLPTTGSRNYVCSQGGWSGSGTGSCVTAVYGSCGSANGGSTTSAPTSSLCSSGSATSVSGSGPYSWTCVGSNGGSNASCGANRSCTTATQSWSVSGSSCSGSTSAISHGGSRTASDSGLPTTGSRSYSCSQGSWSGSGTGSCVTAVYGSCGSANGGSTTSAPTSSLCSSGSATSVSGSGPYSWTCVGSNGGSNASCSSNRSCSSATISWSSCYAGRSTSGHGYSATVSNTRSGYNGSARVTCSQGSWSTSNTSCSSAQVCSPGSRDYSGCRNLCSCEPAYRDCNASGTGYGRCIQPYGCNGGGGGCF